MSFLDRLRGYYSRGRDALFGKPVKQVSPQEYFLQRSDVWSTVSSSNVDAVAYMVDVRRGANVPGILGVRFKNGAVYTYDGVSFGTYLNMLSTSSKGRFVWQQLRDKYPYRRIG